MVSRVVEKLAAASTVRQVENGRLVWYRANLESEFWEEHWKSTFDLATFELHRHGSLGGYEKTFLRHLPTEGRIIEAGCGLGHYVVALSSRGYQVDGVDLANQTLQRVGAFVPDLRLIVADVRNLPVRSGSYSAYVSLGVVEHDKAGPEDALREASRVLAPGGIGIFTVPCFNALRGVAIPKRALERVPPNSVFYQYAFSQSDFCSLLSQAGFSIVSCAGFDVVKGLREEIGVFSRWWARHASTRRAKLLASILERIPFLRRWVGHMLIVVARREA